VIKAVEKAAGHGFDVRYAPRRAGDSTAVVAGADRVRSVLGWKPKHADLDLIVAGALAWEKHLGTRNAAA
jgi:UDP-glucose 4-epimerase